jgi:hypothetical protein
MRTDPARRPQGEPADGLICFVTVTVGEGESDGSVVSTAAATAQFR